MGNRDKSWRYAKREQRVPVLPTRPSSVPAPAPPAPAQLWAAWVKDKPRARWRCIVRAAPTEDHARERLETLTRGNYVQAMVVASGQDPNDGPPTAA